MTHLLATIANPGLRSVQTDFEMPFCRLTDQLESARPAWEPRLDALIRRGRFVLGEELSAFEQEFAAFLGAKFSVGVASGTDAITLSLRASRAKGEVCTTALTAPFTAIAIRAAGLKPRFVDIDENTLQMDPVDLERRLTSSVSAVVAVHLYGQPCRVEDIAALSSNWGTTLVQDACQAHGARANSGRAFTEFGEFVAYSFYPTKNLGCLGDGGAVATNRAQGDRRLRLLRDGGRRKGHVSWVAGINSRLDEIQACFLRVLLARLADANAQRRQLAAAYDEALAGSQGIRTVRRTEASVCHLYVIRAEQRKKLREWLKKDGIQTGIHYAQPLHLHPAFTNPEQPRGSLPKVEAACKEILSLPLWVGMNERDVWRIGERVRTFYS